MSTLKKEMVDLGADNARAAIRWESEKASVRIEYPPYQRRSKDQARRDVVEAACIFCSLAGCSASEEKTVLSKVVVDGPKGIWTTPSSPWHVNIARLIEPCEATHGFEISFRISESRDPKEMALDESVVLEVHHRIQKLLFYDRVLSGSRA